MRNVCIAIQCNDWGRGIHNRNGAIQVQGYVSSQVRLGIGQDVRTHFACIDGTRSKDNTAAIHRVCPSGVYVGVGMTRFVRNVYIPNQRENGSRIVNIQNGYSENLLVNRVMVVGDAYSNTHGRVGLVIQAQGSSKGTVGIDAKEFVVGRPVAIDQGKSECCVNVCIGAVQISDR